MRPLVIALLLAGCTGAPEPGGGGFADTAALSPGGWDEWSFEMDDNATVGVDLAADAPVAWDVHSHAEGSVSTWRNGTGTSASFPFTAPRADTYSVYVRATGVPATVRLSLEGDVRMLAE